MKVCPVCGGTNIESDIIDSCRDCFWEEDIYSEEFPDIGGGVNMISLNEARRRWKRKTGTDVEKEEAHGT